MFDFPHLLMETLFFLEDLHFLCSYLKLRPLCELPQQLWSVETEGTFSIDSKSHYGAHSLCGVCHTLPFFVDNFFSPVQFPQVIKPLSSVIKSPFSIL